MKEMAKQGTAKWPRGQIPWSGVMGMGKVDGFRTVEGLRGRLLAERAASKAAREEAELLGKRMNELERLLAVEIESRNKAEQRLKCILERLESLKIFDISSKSSTTETSGSSPSVCFSRLGELEEGKIRSQKDKSTRLEAHGKAKGRRDLLTLDREHRADESPHAAPPGSIDPSVSSQEAYQLVSVRGSPSHNETIPGREQNKEFQGCLKSAGNGELSADTTRNVCCR